MLKTLAKQTEETKVEILEEEKCQKKNKND